MEDNKATVEQKVEIEQNATPDDLLSRVSKFVETKDPNIKSEDNANNGLTSEDLEASIEAIEDPGLKNKMVALRKSLLSGATNKFQEIAEIRKEMQSFMENSKGQNADWTPERVRALAEDPKFVEAAQSLSGTSEEDEYSTLSDEEKARIGKMNAEIENLKRVNMEALKTQQQNLRIQQHKQYQDKYANYDPNEIDQITFDMLNNKIQATPEHIYKAWKHDDNVRRAYELGRQDEREGVTEKIQSNSVDGIANVASSEKIVPGEKESSQSFFDRIIAKNLKNLKHRS